MLGAALLGKGMADPKKHTLLPHTLSRQIWFLRSDRFGVGGIPKILGHWYPLPWDGDVTDLWKHASPHLC